VKDQQEQHDDLLDRAAEALRCESVPPGPPPEVLARLRDTMTVASQLQDFTQGFAERIAGGGQPVVAPGVEPISIMVRPSTAANDFRRLPLFGYFTQLGPFSYLVSALIMCVAVLGAWQYKMANRLKHLEDTASLTQPAALIPTNAELEPVGRVSGMDECRWGADASQDSSEERLVGPSDLAILSSVSSGRKIHLKSGLLEISYRNGATVVLQGPVTFETNAEGGFLSFGKLTGKLDRKARDFDSQSIVASSTPFIIRTPTAVVTDLGTEFSVRVDSDGRTTSRVFRGAVRIHPTAAADDRQDCVLREDEAVQVADRSDQGILIRHIQGDDGEGRRPVMVHGTGTQRRALDGDPHWEVIAVSGRPDFQPVAADRVGCPRSWQPEGAGRTHWISTFAIPPDELQAGTTYTFRTTIRLNGATPASAIVKGWFLTNGHVGAIRLNGETMSVPEHGEDACRIFSKFTLDRGFVDGDNTLEIDVVKSERKTVSGDYSPFVSLCVDFVGGLQVR